LKICIDATPIGLKTTDKGGVYRYIFELVRALQSVDGKNHYTLFINFFNKAHVEYFHETVRALNLQKNFKCRLSRFPPRIRNMLLIPAEVLTGPFDVFHGCFDSLPPVLFGRSVVTIHDVRYMEMPNVKTDDDVVSILERRSPDPDYFIQDYMFQGQLFGHLRSTIKKTIGRATVVITVSEFSKERLVKIMNVPEEKVKVISHGLNSNFTPRSKDAVSLCLRKYAIKEPYILYAGKFDPLKNLDRVVEAFSIALSSDELTLVMAGPVNWYSYVILDRVEQLGLKEKVIFTGFVQDEDIVSMYSGASAFLLPSLYEGFGMPLLEAMACDVPVITSAVSAIPEVAGDAALYVDPHSSEDIAGGISRCLNDNALREGLIQKGREQVRSVSWEKTAQRTLKVYEEACQ
jgi:glycosyltransferase involved in cell wall biosynthesis